MEINLYRTDEDVLAEFQADLDHQIEKHLVKMTQLNVKLKAEANRARF